MRKEIAGPGVTGPAVLDIGPGLGALLVRTSTDWLGGEIEVGPVGGGGPRVHTGVHLRRAGAASVAAALFPGLAPGAWQLYGIDGSTLRQVHIAGGSVTDIDCR